MKLFAAVMILSASFVHGEGKTFDFKSPVGVVDVNERGNACLIISNAGLNNGLPINVIILSSRQSVIKASIKEKLSNNESKLKERQGAAIAVVSSTRVVIKHGKASVDLDNDGRREFFRHCTSNMQEERLYVTPSINELKGNVRPQNGLAPGCGQNHLR